MATRKGTIKKTPLSSFKNPNARGLIAIAIDADDELIVAAITEGDSQVVLASRSGKTIRFTESDVRITGRTARGVRGIRLGAGDAVVSMAVVNTDGTLLTVTEKAVSPSDLPF